MTSTTDLSAYALATLWEDADFVLSRGTPRTERDHGRVLVLAPKDTKATGAGRSHLARAFSLRFDLQSPWAACPIALLEHEGRPALITEDPGAELLVGQVGAPWSVGPFLRVAIGATVALGQLHARGLIHKDVKPSNIFANAESGEVWLTGFGITSRLPRERQIPEPPEVIAGTLAYMAPEQTGRMNRSIDSRSDLYALGVTLYEMLAGTLPFTAVDPMEWVHCHIARHPLPLDAKVKGVPQAISSIVMKLLAKTAEDRYQTAAGVENDLRRALAEWETSGRIESFVPGGRDASDRLLIPEKLYGRDSEIGVLLSSFDRVLAHGTTQLVLVSGYSGIGKSSVVNELHRVLVPPRGLYASGKFDQYKRDIPYATLAQAFVGLIRHVLGKSEKEVAVWREKLVRALGPNGQVMTTLLPELELVIGKQPPVPELSLENAQGRFQNVVRRFLGVFAQAEHPLALFLDDLQWLDAATLALLEKLLADPEVRHLLLVAAYRDNEVGPAHPLAQTLERLRADGERTREIVLSPLAVDDIARLYGDALHAEVDSVRPLAELVHAKTGGNPFFAIQFISTLVDERLVEFNASRAVWQWDIDAIHAKRFTDNVVELMALKLHRFPAVTKSAIRQLACLGSSARITTLSFVYGVPVDRLHEALADAVSAGLISSTAGRYAFLHDRVHEAAYAMLGEEDRGAEHLRIGMLLASRFTAPEELQENIFEIVSHLNRGTALIESRDERERAAELNLLAARHAKASTAHAEARAYAALGRSLLGSDPWERSFRLTFDLELQIAECDFVLADLRAAEDRLEVLGARASTLTDRAAVIVVQTNLYTAMADRSDRAVEICLAYLNLVGITGWVAHPTDEMVQREYQVLVDRIGGRAIGDLLHLPLASDVDVIATAEVLMGMFTPAFNTDRRLVGLILCRLASLGIEHGNTEPTSLAYAFLGMLLGSVFGDYQTGFSFGKLARDLVEVRGFKRYSGRIYHTLGHHVLPWTQPIATCIASLRRGLQVMQEIGDVTYVSFSHIGIMALRIGSGEDLELLDVEAEASLALVREGKFELAIDGCIGHLRLIRALRGLLPDPCTLEEPDRVFFSDHTRSWYWLRAMQACFVFGDFDSALVAAAKVAPLLMLSAGFFELPEYHFYAALARAAVFDATAEASGEHRRELAEHREKLALWAAHCSESFANRVALIDAEIARIEGRPLDAMEAYELAIRSARDHGFVNNEAIAFEVAARFYASRGFDAIADTYIEKACARYRRWGATGKVRALELAHPRLRPAPADVSAPSVASQLEGIDLKAVVKTSQAVSLQVGVERLIDSLMVIVLQHAGAERGLLVLQRTDGLWIEAEATTTRDGVSVRLHHAAIGGELLSEPVLRYAVRSHETVLIDDAQLSNQFSPDPYLARHACRSVLCLPLVKQNEVIGALYLENNLAPQVFTPSRVEVLKLLASQAAISLENASLEEKEALLKEVHHRVKNNLQLISSMLNLQASRIKDPAVAELFADSRNRVRSMALVHENLYRAGNFSKISMDGHIKALCAQLTRAYGVPGQRVSLDVEVDDLQLDMSRAVTCGLIVNELVSNALKHAFPDGRGGRIQIHVELQPDGRHALRVRDDGVGLPERFDFEHADTLGLQLVSDLTHQLRGTIAVSRDRGTTFTISFDETPSTSRG